MVEHCGSQIEMRLFSRLSVIQLGSTDNDKLGVTDRNNHTFIWSHVTNKFDLLINKTVTKVGLTVVTQLNWYARLG